MFYIASAISPFPVRVACSSAAEFRWDKTISCDYTHTSCLFTFINCMCLSAQSMRDGNAPDSHLKLYPWLYAFVFKFDSSSYFSSLVCSLSLHTIVVPTVPTLMSGALALGLWVWRCFIPNLDRLRLFRCLFLFCTFSYKVVWSDHICAF